MEYKVRDYGMDPWNQTWDLIFPSTMFYGHVEQPL